MRQQIIRLVFGLFASFFVLASPAAAKLYITIDISDQQMLVSKGGLFASHSWKVSTGRKGYSTPHGTYKPYLLKKMHYSSKYDNSPMPHSIFFKGGYAIHATPYVKNLGRPASHGCIRLDPRHAKKLFELVREAGNHNTIIEIVP
jgi:lipoprotein-anchoring transpeptidase ErfK/SrfK